MGSIVLLDNDVALKCSCYKLVDETIRLLSSCGRVAALGSARFVLERRIARGNGIADRAVAKAELDRFFAQACALEPDEIEVSLAAELEGEAQSRSIPLDVGESLLVAVLVIRGAPLLVTGDKRAIAAIELLATAISRLKVAAGRLACLEQLVASLITRLGASQVRAHVCSEPQADRALSLCFSCGSACFDSISAMEGLNSYINSLRQIAGEALMPNHDLSPVVA